MPQLSQPLQRPAEVTCEWSLGAAESIPIFTSVSQLEYSTVCILRFEKRTHFIGLLKMAVTVNCTKEDKVALNKMHLCFYRHETV